MPKLAIGIAKITTTNVRLDGCFASNMEQASESHRYINPTIWRTDGSSTSVSKRNVTDKNPLRDFNNGYVVKIHNHL